jgi:hypothetical protein
VFRRKILTVAGVVAPTGRYAAQPVCRSVVVSTTSGYRKLGKFMGWLHSVHFIHQQPEPVSISMIEAFIADLEHC